MEVNINKLIQTIKSDGIEAGKEKESQIIKEAEQKADSILVKAKADAENIIKNAKLEADKLIQTGNDALAQAGRDLILKIENEIQNIFNSILKDAITENFSGKILEDSITKAVQTIADDAANLDLLISEKDYKELETSLKNALKNELAKGLEIKPFNNIQTGFRLALKDGSAFYDFSANEISSMLTQLLSKKFSDFLK